MEAEDIGRVRMGLRSLSQACKRSGSRNQRVLSAIAEALMSDTSRNPSRTADGDL